MDRYPLDANASYGVLSEVREALAQIPSTFLNPSSAHSSGQKARALVEEARDRVREFIGASPKTRVVFTSGATEANNMAVQLPFSSGDAQRAPSRILTTPLEHHSILEPVKRMKASGVEVDYISYQDLGAQNVEEKIAHFVTPYTKLFTCMGANNETGECFPLATYGAAVRQLNPNTLIHTDAVQMLGKESLSWSALGVDALSISAHKVGGISGCGALVVSDRVEAHPFILGGPQETRWRAGTENVYGIYAFGVAAAYWKREQEKITTQMQRARDALEQLLCQAIPGCSVIAESRPRLVNTSLLMFPHVRGDDLVVALDVAGIEASTGAACASGKRDPSHVLLAMGYSLEEARRCVRLSVHGGLSVERAREVAKKIVHVVERMTRA